MSTGISDTDVVHKCWVVIMLLTFILVVMVDMPGGDSVFIDDEKSFSIKLVLCELRLSLVLLMLWMLLLLITV